MHLGLISGIILGVSIIVGSVSHLIFKKKDSAVEQIAEKIIESQTGIDIDFTPEDKSKLNRKNKKSKARKD